MVRDTEYVGSSGLTDERRTRFQLIKLSQRNFPALWTADFVIGEVKREESENIQVAGHILDGVMVSY